MDVLFFPEPEDFRKWLEQHHTTCTEQWVGFYKKATKKPSITWSESVDEALCYGWIDGLRKSIDAESYKIRFTPRRSKSHWSDVNIKKVAELKKEGRMQTAGLEAFAKLTESQSRNASYEQNNVQLDDVYLQQIKADPEAWAYFDQKLAPFAKKITVWYVMSAKREETRQRRLKTVIESSREGEKIPQLRSGK